MDFNLPSICPPIRNGGYSTHCSTESCNNYIFDRVCNTGQPMSKHKIQAHCYMLAEGKDEIIFVYIKRESPNEIVEILYKWEDEVYEFLEKWIQPILVKFPAGWDFPEAFDVDNEGCIGCSYYSYNREKFSPMLGRII